MPEPIGIRDEVSECWTAYVRAKHGTPHEPRIFGPKTARHFSCGQPCPACHIPFAVGDYTTLLALGPGDDQEMQTRAREGRWYNAVAIEVHLACGTGAVPPEATVGEPCTQETPTT